MRTFEVAKPGRADQVAGAGWGCEVKKLAVRAAAADDGASKDEALGGCNDVQAVPWHAQVLGEVVDGIVDGVMCPEKVWVAVVDVAEQGGARGSDLSP